MTQRVPSPAGRPSTEGPEALRLRGVVMPPSVCRRVAGVLLRWVCQAANDGMHIDPEVRAWVEAVRAEADATHDDEGSDTGTSEYRLSPPVAPSPYGIDTQEAARRLGCSSRNVTAAARRGSLPGQRIAGRWWFDPDDVAAYQQRQRDPD